MGLEIAKGAWMMVRRVSGPFIRAQGGAEGRVGRGKNGLGWQASTGRSSYARREGRTDVGELKLTGATLILRSSSHPHRRRVQPGWYRGPSCPHYYLA